MYVYAWLLLLLLFPLLRSALFIGFIDLCVPLDGTYSTFYTGDIYVVDVTL